MYNLEESCINAFELEIAGQGLKFSPGDRIDGQEERSAQDLSLPQVWRVVLVHLEVVLGGDARRHPARQGPLLVDGHLLSLLLK